MSLEYKHQKNIVIHQDLNGISSFSKSIKLEFIPKIMRVKNVSYVTAAAETNMCALRSNTLNEKICCFYDGVAQSTTLEFKLNDISFQGDHEFALLNEDDALRNDMVGILVVFLEFLG